MPSICPGGGDDSPFLGCFPNSLLCNLASDCPGGIDERNCINYGKTHSFYEQEQYSLLLLAPLFLEFGEGVGDTIFLSPCGGTDDNNSPLIHVDIPLLIFQQQLTELFVSSYSTLIVVVVVRFSLLVCRCLQMVLSH